MIVRGQGHPAVRATHGKTLEFTPESELGPGGTCVVAVRAGADGDALAGAVDCELTAGVHRIAFAAIANPDWDRRGRAVIRRSGVTRPDTLATHASLAARDLPPDLVDALRDPAQLVELSLRRARPQPDRLVIIGAGEAPAAELAAADLLAEAGTVGVHGRVLSIGVPSPALLAAAPQPIEVHTVPVQRAVALASPFGADAVLGTVRDVAAKREHAVVLRVHAGEFGKVIRSARRHGRRTGAVAGHLPWVSWGDLESLRAPVGVRAIWLCLDPSPPVDLTGRIAAARAAGLATKQIARDLAEEFGLPVKDVYAQVLASGGG